MSGFRKCPVGMATKPSNLSKVTSGASESNPFGAFTFNFELFDQLEGTQNGAGEIVASDSVENSIGFTLYESSTRGADTYVQSASVVMSADRSTGSAITSADRGSNTGSAYALAFNSNNVLIQNATDIDSLPLKRAVIPAMSRQNPVQ